MVTLQNSYIKAEISEYAAELKSIEFDGKEYMWCADPAIWDRSAPMCFPICSNLKGGKFTLEGKEYVLEKHGFANSVYFDVEECDGTHAVFLHRSNEEIKRKYPFDYELRVIYTLEDTSIKIEYEVRNTGTGDMYYNVGAHEAYCTPEGIEEYEVVFESDDKLKNYLCDGEVITDNYEELSIPGGVFALDEEYFDQKSLIFENFQSRSLIFRQKDGKRAIKVAFPDFPYLLLWHFVGANYMCIEPWNGLPDVAGSSYEISEKVAVRRVRAGECETTVHTITILK